MREKRNLWATGRRKILLFALMFCWGMSVCMVQTVMAAGGGSIGNCKIEFKDASLARSKAITYTGKAITPEIVVTAADGSVLQKDVDYTVQYEDNTNCGVGRIIIIGKDNYENYHILKYGITPKKVTGIKVKSPFAMEATVTWNKVSGADGFYIYRKPSGGSYKFVANVTDGNYQVFHDRDKSLKNNKKYTYKIVPYVVDDYSGEPLDGWQYEGPSFSGNDAGREFLDPHDPHVSYTDYDSYYEEQDNNYYRFYNYSCIKGKCEDAYEAASAAAGSGKVTKTADNKFYTIYTGDANIDYMVSVINKKIIKGKMNTEKRVRAIFDWMVKNCTFTKDVKDYEKLSKMKRYINYSKPSNIKKAEAYEKKARKQIYEGKALCIGMNWHDSYRAEVALDYRKGSCSYLTPMFNVLCNGAGVEAYIVDGNYVNSDKSRMYHNWSFVKIGNKYYWFDVPVACKNKTAKDTWYKKGTKFWKTCHEWDKNATKGFSSSMFAK
ncbi:MAG TPA: hypothetical protein DF613_08285 [Lachnospiraceae bacterium]|nr:hypothetical protein [Lachnospiraceae bacterium]